MNKNTWLVISAAVLFIVSNQSNASCLDNHQVGYTLEDFNKELEGHKKTLKSIYDKKLISEDHYSRMLKQLDDAAKDEDKLCELLDQYNK